MPLAFFFIKKAAERFGVPQKRLSEKAKAQLLAYDWYGNVRELENTIERSFILSSGDIIDEIIFEDEPVVYDISDKDSIVPYAEAKNRFEREYLKKLLKLSEGNISKASRLSGKTRAEIYRLLRKHGLSSK